MPKEKGINVKLLEQISEHVLAEPRRVNMDIWLDTNKIKYEHKCHTVGCIAGWAVALKGTKEERKNHFYFAVKNAAMRLLRLREGDADELFLPDNWPTKYITKLRDYDEGTKGYAKVVAARIKAFIKEKTSDRDS